MGFSCGSAVPDYVGQPVKLARIAATNNLSPAPPRRKYVVAHDEKCSAMQTAIIPRSRIETLQSPDWPALPSKSAPPVSALRRGSSHPGSTQKTSPAARPKSAHTPGSTAHGESSFPADPAPSASASPKHVLSCPSVYQFTPTPRSAHLQVDRSSAVIQNLTQPSQTQTETHSPPPSQSPPLSIQSSTHSDIPLPTTYETSPDHP